MNTYIYIISFFFTSIVFTNKCIAQTLNLNGKDSDASILQFRSTKSYLKKDPLQLESLTNDQFLERIQYDYTKLCLQSKDSIVSVEVDGYFINLLPVACKNRWIKRSHAAKEVLEYLFAFERAKTIKGFFPRSFNRQTGERATIRYWTFGRPYDVYGTAVIAASLRYIIAPFFNKGTADEIEIRRLCTTITERIDWNFAYNEEKGCFTWFKNGDYAEQFDGKDLIGIWDETFFIQLVALDDKKWKYGMQGYSNFTNLLKVDSAFGFRYYPVLQLGYAAQSFLWFDLRAFEDEATKRNRLNYFQSVKNAVSVQLAYVQQNPKQYPHYGKVWGVSDMPLDKGTIQLEEVFAAMLFEPDSAIQCLRNIYTTFKRQQVYTSQGMHGSIDVVKETVQPLTVSKSWFGFYLPLNVLYIENYRSGLLWQLSATVKDNIVVVLKSKFQN